MNQSNEDFTFEVISSLDLDNHLSNLIRNISDDDCESIISSQRYVSKESADNCSSATLSQLEEDKLLQSCTNENSENKPSEDAEVQIGKHVVVVELSLDHRSKKPDVLSEITTDFSGQIIDSCCKEFHSNFENEVIEKIEFKKSCKRKNSEHSDSEDPDQSYCLSSSWPRDSSKLEQKKCKLDTELIKVEKVYDIEPDCLKAETSSIAANHKLLLGEVGLMPVSSHCCEVLYEQMVIQSSVETGSDCKTEAIIPQGISRCQKSVAETHATTQCVNDGPASAIESVKTILLHKKEESSHSPQKSTLGLENDACSQPDEYQLNSKNKSPLVNSSMSLKVGIPLLSLDVLSPISTLLPQDSLNQSGVNSVIYSSPKRSDVFMASLHSPMWSHKEEPRTIQLLSSPTSVKPSLSPCCTSNTSQHNDLPSQADTLIAQIPEETTFAESLPVKNVPHALSSVLDYANNVLNPSEHLAIVIPSHCEFLDESECPRQGEVFTVAPSVDKKMSITHDLSSTPQKELPARIYERIKTLICEISARDTLSEHVNPALNNHVQELSHHPYNKHNIGTISEYEYEKMPRSPQMLMNMDGIPCPLPSDDHIVPEYKEDLEERENSMESLESNAVASENDKKWKETNQTLFLDEEKLHSTVAVAGSSSLQNYEASLSWPHLMSTCTAQCQDSTRVSLIISTRLDDDKKDTVTVSSTEEIGNLLQHCSGKQTHSHLSNEPLIFPFEDTVTDDEHRVPETESCEDVSLSEVSLYSNHPGHNQDDLKHQNRQAFQWTSVYETVMNKSLTDQTTGNSTFEGLSSILPICQSQRPRRIGLSRKQNVKHLHNKQ